jgi:hypothetical protein
VRTFEIRHAAGGDLRLMQIEESEMHG